MSGVTQDPTLRTMAMAYYCLDASAEIVRSAIKFAEEEEASPVMLGRMRITLDMLERLKETNLTVSRQIREEG